MIALANASQMRSIRSLIKDLDKPLEVLQLAEVAGFSRAHFSRMFADSEGLPPAAFVLQERMRRAARLLTSHSLLPIKEIANLCGFDEPNYFAKVFRRFFGTCVRRRCSGTVICFDSSIASANPSAASTAPSPKSSVS